MTEKPILTFEEALKKYYRACEAALTFIDCWYGKDKNGERVWFLPPDEEGICEHVAEHHLVYAIMKYLAGRRMRHMSLYFPMDYLDDYLEEVQYTLSDNY